MPVELLRVLLVFFGDALFDDVVDSVLHRGYLLGVLVGDLDALAFLAELLFERHDELDKIQRVSVQILHKRCLRCDFDSSTPSCSAMIFRTRSKHGAPDTSLAVRSWL